MKSDGFIKNKDNSTRLVFEAGKYSSAVYLFNVDLDL